MNGNWNRREFLQKAGAATIAALAAGTPMSGLLSSCAKNKIKSKADLPDNFAVGLGIYTTEGSYVLGANTKRSGYKIDKKSRLVSIAFPKCPLLRNKYFINVALSDVSEKLPIEFKGQVLFFKSIASDEFRGSTLLEHKWTQQ